MTSVLAALFLASMVVFPQEVPPGKTKTDRSIALQVVVAGTPAEVFALWTREEGANRFFGVESRIELRRGGAYEIYFVPRGGPDSDVNSSKGARIIDYDRGRFLSFDWTFPPMALELHREPLPMWVEVRFEEIGGAQGHTRVQLRAEGFERGPLWDQTYEFFVRGWSDILYRLQKAQLQ